MMRLDVRISETIPMAGDLKKRFVVQEHVRAGDRHWDLMLEADAVLWTWRVAVCPKDMTEAAVEAVRIFDHQVRFLEYEGPVNDGRGSVRIAESGTYELAGELADYMEICFWGKVLTGLFELKRVDRDRWTMEPKRPVV